MDWLNDYFSDWLSDFLTDEGSQYRDLDYAVSTIQQGRLEWQAVASIAFRIALLHLDSKPTNAERTLAQRIAESVLEPLEALIKSKVDKPDTESSQGDRARMLFHAQFALGELHMVRGDVDRAADILAQVVLTKPTIEVRRVKSSGGVYEEHTYMEGAERVFHSVDIIFGKTLASYEIAPRFINKGAYRKAMHLLTEAARSFPWIFTFNFITMWVDAWIERCMRANDLGQWVDLMDTVAEIVSIGDGGEEIAQSGSSPSKCEVTSSNYWAWNFGKIVGKLHIYEKTDIVEPLMEDYYPSLMEWKNGLAFVSLWSECDEKRDWEIARTFYHEMWERTANYYGARLFEEGAESGLYWAMRVGLADAFLEYSMSAEKFASTIQPQVLTDISEVLDKAPPKPMNEILQQLEAAKQEASEPTFIRDIKERTETGERLNRDYFSGLWEVMKGKTRELLISIEIAWIHRNLGHMANEIRRMLEVELPAIFPFLEPAIDRSDHRLILTRMKDELLTNKVVRASVDGLRIHDRHKIWIRDQLPEFLSNVIAARNYFEKDEHLPIKRSHRNQDMIDKAESIHRELLGIGTEGVLPQLLRVKKASRGG